MAKGIRNADAVAYKLKPALTRATNHRLKVAREKKRKSKKIVEKQKTKAIVVKHRKNRGGISLSSRDKANYKNDIKDDMDLD